MGSGIGPVAAHHPQLLRPIRDYFQKRTTNIIRESARPVETLAVMLLADGLWLFDALAIAPFTGPIRDNVRACVLTWANGDHPDNQKTVKRSRTR